MSDIMYNTETGEVVMILGYGIGNHLSMKFLKETVQRILKIFPDIPEKIQNEMPFLEVSQSSRRHKYHWYTRFPYKLEWDGKADYIEYNGESIYAVTGHKISEDTWVTKDESATDVMNRLIHD